MLIGFIGDVHGKVLDALAAVAAWQERLPRPLGAIIQVGDMGSFPDPDRADLATRAYMRVDNSERDFERLLRADDELAAFVETLVDRVSMPIYYVRGNHEDFDYLSTLTVDVTTGAASVDPFGALAYVPDGTVLELDGARLAFLGGVEERSDAASIDRDALERLQALPAGSIDVLVSHEGPYGHYRTFLGEVGGSKLMSALVATLRPRFHVAGHAHQLVGPLVDGETTYLGLHGLVASRRHHPEARGLQRGCLGLLDIEAGTLEAVTDDWLQEFDTPVWASR